MVFYALTDSRLADTELGEVFDFYVSREEAEEALRDVLTDEPEWRCVVGITEVDFDGYHQSN
jgi:hypothetical protein